MKHWTNVERREYEAIIQQVLDATTVSKDRTRLLVDLVNDAIQAHRAWAKDLLEDMIMRGAASVWKAEAKKAHILVDLDGRVVSKSRTVGTKRLVNGEMADQQVLLETLTWDEIKAKREEWKRNIQAFADNVAIADRLLDLKREGVETPVEALDQLGVSVEQFLNAGAL